MSGPICLEWENGGECGATATHEYRSPLDDVWVALCGKHIRAWSPALTRVLTPDRSDAHELAQYRAGTLPRDPTRTAEKVL